LPVLVLLLFATDLFASFGKQLVYERFTGRSVLLDSFLRPFEATAKCGYAKLVINEIELNDIAGPDAEGITELGGDDETAFIAHFSANGLVGKGRFEGEWHVRLQCY
jgi:hypothetical protein